jgi:2,3-dihydroxybenzoate-AMP ligase
MHPIPLIHNAGIAAAMQPAHFAGARFVLPPGPDPETVLALIEQERVQVLPVVPPTLLARILDRAGKSARDLSSLTHVIVGGQKLPLTLAERVERELGVPCLQMFGMAEGMFMRTTEGSPEWVRKHTVGAPISPLDEVRILAPGEERELGSGEIGELCCRGPYTIRGYFNAPDHNASVFTSDGFYRTGDLARAHVVDGAVCYSVEGRIKDMINRGAEKINAEEVEEVLASHAAVGAVAVVAMPDEEMGERVCAYVTLAGGPGGLTLGDLVAHAVAAGLAKFKLPERLELIDGLPQANIGKVDKKTLRADIASKLGTEQAVPGDAGGAHASASATSALVS